MVLQKLFLLGVVILAGRGVNAQNNPDAINYVNTYKEIAITEMQRSGVPAAITLAQGIHESESGTSDLVRRSNNHFGIKCKDEWTGDKVYHDDDARGECFRSYSSPLDSYRDHSDFLKLRPYYASLFTLDPADYEAWANGLRKCGYATNPKYAQILIKIIQDYNLEQYSLIGLGKMKASEEIVMTAAGVNCSPLREVSLWARCGPIGSNGSGVFVGGGNVGSQGSGAGGSQGVVGSQGSGAGGSQGTAGGYGTKGRNSSSRVGVVVDAAGYPEGEFQINRTRVVFVKAGTSLLSIADQYDIALSKLLEFNELEQQDILDANQLLFLQRKRKTGASAFHVAREGETLYDICQAEGVRFQELMEMNHMGPGSLPATGEKIYLQGSAPSRPLAGK